VILEHSVLGLHTCLVPVFLSFPLLLCIPCLGSALQYTPLRLLSAFIHLVCITSTSIPASLHCTCFVIARQTFCFVVDIQGKPIIVHVGHYGQLTITLLRLRAFRGGSLQIRDNSADVALIVIVLVITCLLDD
jgi:hypothetical protein